MASSRSVELIFKVTDLAGKELQGIRKELEALQGLQGEYEKTRTSTQRVGAEAEGSSRKWASGLGGIQKLVGAIGGAYMGVRQAINDAMMAGRGMYEYLIGANERLNQQIISSAANIAATNKVMRDGVTIDSATEAIEALQPKLRATLEQIQRDSVELVGVTSQDLNGVFQTLSANVNKFSNQSNQITDPLAAAGKLTIDFAATLGTLKIPLHQAGQEINSLLSATADQNSLIAIQLFGSAQKANEMIKKWKEQGVLVDKLREKMAAFTEANAMGARSIAGYSSNIRDVLEIMGKDIGKPLLEPAVAALEIVYNLVKENQAAFTSLAENVIGRVLEIAGGLTDKLAPVAEDLYSIAQDMGRVLVGLLPLVTDLIGVVAALPTPLIDVLKTLTGILAAFLDTAIGKSIAEMGIMAAVLAPVVGSLISLSAQLIILKANITATIILNGGLQASFIKVGASAMTAAAGIQKAVIALAPLAIAVGSVAAAVGLIGIGLKSIVMDDQNKAVEEMQSSTNALSDEALKYATELKALNDLEKQNGSLTEEQKRKRDALRSVTGQLTKDIDAQIAELKGMKGGNEDVNAALDIQIGLLERQKELLGNQSGLEIAAQDLQDFGTYAEQGARKIREITNAINDPNVSQTDFDTRVKGFIQSSNQLVATGAADAKEVQDILLQLSQDTRLSLEERQNAEKALSQILGSESKNRQDAIASEIADIKDKAEQGTISRIDAEKRVTELTRQQIQERLTAVNEELARKLAAGEDGAAVDALRNQQAQLNQELETLNTGSQQRLTQLAIDEGQKRVDAIALEIKQIEAEVLRGEITRSEAEQRISAKTVEQVQARIDAVNKALETAQGSEKRKLTQQLQELNLEREKLTIEGAQKVQAAQLKELELAQDKALDQVRLAETQRITELERLRLQEPELAAQIERQIVQIRKEGVAETLRLEQERLAFLESQGALTGEAEIQRQDQIRASRQRTAELTQQLVQQEAEAQRAITAEINQRIDRQTQQITNSLTAQTQEYEKQLQLIQLATQAESTRLELLNAQKALIQSRAGLEQTVYQIAIAATTDERKKAQLAEKAAQAKLAAKMREVAIDAQLFEMQEMQRKLELEGEKIQARIAQIKTRAALAEAQASAAKTLADPTATKEQKAAALLGVKAAEMGVVGADASAALTDFKAETNDQMSGLRREAFQNQQQNEILNAQFEAANAIADPGRKQSALTQLSRSAQLETGVNANSSVRTVTVGLPTQNQGTASTALNDITASFNNLFGGISEQIDGMLKGFNIDFNAMNPLADGTTPVGVNSTKLSQNNITISQVNFTNRIERDSDRAMLDKIRRGITDDLSNMFNQAAASA